MVEYLDIVNEQNKVIGKDTKENKLTKRFISRNVAIFIRDHAKQYIIVQRSKKKLFYPGLFDLGACGHVQSGETYEEAARREVLEELGITCELQFLITKFTDLTHTGKPWQFFTGVFLGEYDGPVVLNDESENYIKMTLPELEKMMSFKPHLFVPAFHGDLQQVKHLLQ